MTRPRRTGVSRDQRGVVGLIGVIVFSTAILIIGTGLAATSINNHQVSNTRINSTQSVYNAESGAEDALLQIKRNVSYGSTTTSLTTTFSSTNRVETTVENPNTPGCTQSRLVTASGYVNDLVRRIQLTNCATPSVTAQFAYAVQAGYGGIEMKNNSRVNGTTYSNGNHIGSNGATVSGDAWVAGTAAGTATPQFDPATVTDFTFGNSAAANQIDAAQSFIADTSANSKLIKVSLKVKKIGAPSNATVRIVTDNSDKPSGTQVASGTLNAASVGITYGFIDVSMTAPPTLSGGNKYWIVIDSGSSATNYWSWASDNSFAAGSGKYSPQWKSSGPMTWTAANTDFAFKAFMGTDPTLISNMIVGGAVHANTITSNTITGNAYFQTNNGSTIGGTSYPGSADPPARDLPISDANVQDFRDEAIVGGTHTGDYIIDIGQTQSLGPKKITGKLIVQNGGTLILSGTLWVQGEIIFSNNAKLQLSASYGSSSGAIVGDYKVTIQNNVEVLGSTGSNFIMLISTLATNDAMTISNNANGIILVATKGTLNVQNNATANALAAHQLLLQNNAVITYSSGLADVNFSGPGGSFEAGGWQEIVLD